MKKTLVISFGFIFALVAIIFLSRKVINNVYAPQQKIVQMQKQVVSSTPTQSAYTPEKDIQNFMEEHTQQVQGVKLAAHDPHNLMQAGEPVDHYTDSEQRYYDVQVSTNKVIMYFARTSKADTTKPVITFIQAQAFAKQIMEDDMPGFDTFAKTATYNPEQSSGLYIINWVGNITLTATQKAYFQQKGIEPAQYHMQVVLDRYGNLRNFDNEFLGNG